MDTGRDSSQVMKTGNDTDRTVSAHSEVADIVEEENTTEGVGGRGRDQ